MKKDSTALLLALAFILIMFFIAHKIESQPQPVTYVSKYTR